MLSKKLLLDIFGEKIKPYGFELAGYKHRRYTFSRKVDGTEQTFVIQNDPGGHSFELEINADTDRNLYLHEFWDLDYHFYRNDEELEKILNTLGDHVVNRVIPRLAEVSMMEEEVDYEDMLTEEMYTQLEQEKDELIQRFMERNRIDAGQGTDAAMGNLLRELEQIKGLSFEETVEERKELAAVYGDIIIREIGGEWVRREACVRDLIVEGICSVVPLNAVTACCQKGGGALLAEKYVQCLQDYRERVEWSQQEYGSNWMPLRSSDEADTGLLTREIVKRTLGKKLAGIGFRFNRLGGSGWALERVEAGEKLGVWVGEESCHRKAFFLRFCRYEGFRLEECRYKKFCYYEDEAELCRQLEEAVDKVLEVIHTGQWIPDPYIPRHCKCCHVTDEMADEFKAGRTEMAERFRKRHGLEKTSEEADIVQCIVKELDSIAVRERDPGEIRRHYEEKKGQLMELGAAYGELLIREIGGEWTKDEEERMRRVPVCLVGVPVMGRIDLPQEMIRHWEHFGSEVFLHTHQKYKWAYDKWRRLCQLAGIEIRAEKKLR